MSLFSRPRWTGRPIPLLATSCTPVKRFLSIAWPFAFVLLPSIYLQSKSHCTSSRIYSINASLCVLLAAPVLGFSWNPVPTFSCACWIAVGLATLSAILSVLQPSRTAKFPVDFSRQFHRLRFDVRPILHIRRTTRCGQRPRPS